MIDFKKALLSWQLVVALMVSLGVIGITQFMNQKQVHKAFIRDQEKLLIQYETRLGMWSPK